MIQPNDIRIKAERLYPKFLRAWLMGETFFPKTIPCEKRLDRNPATAIQSVQQLRAGSKEVLGHGYCVEWEEINSRLHGRNQFPQRIMFETQDDYLRLIGRQREFATFASAVEQVRSQFPELESWMQTNRRLLIDSADELDGLLSVLKYFCAHPRPGVFARELPIPVDTKFIERNERVLQEWFDRVLPPHAIRADESHFARRYGLRYPEPHILIRFLDPAIREQSGVPWSECTVPLHSLAETPLAARRFLIVENKVNLLTLPPLSETLSLGGLGNSVTDLRYVSWLQSGEIWYWGDLDVDGLAILSRLRTVFPQTQSLLMDGETTSRWKDELGQKGNGRSIAMPPKLTEAEQAAFLVCDVENLRIEQERFPQEFIVEFLQSRLVG